MLIVMNQFHSTDWCISCKAAPTTRIDGELFVVVPPLLHHRLPSGVQNLATLPKEQGRKVVLLILWKVGRLKSMEDNGNEQRKPCNNNILQHAMLLERKGKALLLSVETFSSNIVMVIQLNGSGLGELFSFYCQQRTRWSTQEFCPVEAVTVEKYSTIIGYYRE